MSSSRNPVLVAEFSSFILGEDDTCEVDGQHGPHRLRNMFIKRIDHLSDLVR